jgi:Spy/CpxP family protein refolding chaperone
MRAFAKLFVIAVAALVAAGMAGSQPPFGGGFGKANKGGDYFNLLQNGQIKEELKVTDQQAEKLPAAALKALAEVLDDKQVKRLRQIYLQQRGNFVYLEADVKKELKITDAQGTKIKAALDHQAKEVQAMFDAKELDFDKMQELQKTATETVQNVLTADQKTAWTKMIGEPFQMKFGKGKKGPPEGY